MRSIVGPSLRPGVRAPLACNIAAMRDIANGFRPEELSKNAFRLYEKFRPAIPEGVTGWGAKGSLDLDRIRSLASEK